MAPKTPESPVRIIGSRELHQNLPGILRDLEDGTVRYVLTVHGKPRAVLVGAEPYLNMISDGKGSSEVLVGLQLSALLGGRLDAVPLDDIEKAMDFEGQLSVPVRARRTGSSLSSLRRASRSSELASMIIGMIEITMIATITRWKFFWTDLQPAEPPASEQKGDDPDRAARHVVDREAGIAHLADAGDERGEGPDDRHEPRQDDREAAVLLVELVGAQQVLLVQEPRVLAREDLRPDEVADGVVDRVAQDGRDDQEHRHRPQLDRRLGMAVTAPTAKSSESPGRKGVTTSPVSAKMIRKRTI